VKSFNEQNNFHHIESNGIIDRDRRNQDDVIRLNSKNIWVLDVAEAENLLLLEEIVKAVANHMGKNSTEVFEQVKQNLINFFRSRLESQILIHFQETLKRELSSASNFSNQNITDVISEVDSLVNDIDKQNIYDTIKTEFEEILSTSDYSGILRVFNLKNALIPNSNVCSLTDINNKESYRSLIITLLKKNNETSQRIAESIDQKIIKNAT